MADGDRGEGGDEVATASQYREYESALDAAEKDGRLGHTDPLRLDPGKANYLAGHLRKADRLADRLGQRFDRRVGEEPVPGPGLFPGGLSHGAGGQQNPAFTVNPGQRKCASRSRLHLKDAGRSMSAETAVQDAKHSPSLRPPEGVGQGGHGKRGACQVCGVCIEQHQAAVRGAVTGEPYNDNVVFSRSIKGTEDRHRYLRVPRPLIDEQARGKPLDRIGEQSPQSGGVPARAPEFRNRRVPVLVDADKDCACRHLTP